MQKKRRDTTILLVVEEAHNYIQRSFGEVKSSAILRQVIAEGENSD